MTINVNLTITFVVKFKRRIISIQIIISACLNHYYFLINIFFTLICLEKCFLTCDPGYAAKHIGKNITILIFLKLLITLTTKMLHITKYILN